MDFLMRLCVKGYPQQAGDPAVRTKCGKAAGAIGIVSNILLFAMKLAAGLLAGSVAMIADAVNNLADSASSIVTAVGFKLSAKPADSGHPFGHARIEYLAGMIVSFLVVFVGFQLGTSSIGKILHPSETVFSSLTIVILILSILLKLWQYFFYRKVGRQIDSTTLAATADDSRNDVLATAVILVGAVITNLTGVNLDGYLGLAVAVFILISGGRLIMETANPLLGAAPDSRFTHELARTILSYDGILGVHDLTVHSYGAGRCFASVHCEVSAEEDILKSHDIIDNIERDFASDRGIQLVIHLDPVVTDNPETNRLKDTVREEVRQLYPNASVHDFRVVWGITHSNVLFDVAVLFSEKDSDAVIRRRLEEMVSGLDPTYRAVIVIDRVGDTELDTEK